MERSATCVCHDVYPSDLLDARRGVCVREKDVHSRSASRQFSGLQTLANQPSIRGVVQVIEYAGKKRGAQRVTQRRGGEKERIRKRTFHPGTKVPSSRIVTRRVKWLRRRGTGRRLMLSRNVTSLTCKLLAVDCVACLCRKEEGEKRSRGEQLKGGGSSSGSKRTAGERSTA